MYLEEGTRASKTILQIVTYYMMMVRFGLAIDHIGGCVKNGDQTGAPSICSGW